MNIFLMLALVAAVALAVAVIWRKQRYRANCRRARLIVSSGGPKTKDEWLFLFPDACKHCGSRQRRSFSWSGGSQGDFGASGAMSVSGIVIRCDRDHHIAGDSPDGYRLDDYSENHIKNADIRIGSPYLTKEEADKIPDWAENTL